MKRRLYCPVGRGTVTSAMAWIRPISAIGGGIEGGDGLVAGNSNGGAEGSCGVGSIGAGMGGVTGATGSMSGVISGAGDGGGTSGCVAWPMGTVGIVGIETMEA